jgi:hypothetical protein
VRGIDSTILARFRAFLQKKYGKVNGLQGQLITEALEQWLDKQSGVVVTRGVDSPQQFPVEKVKISKRTERNIDRIRLLLISELRLTPEAVPEYIQQVILTGFIAMVITDYRYRRKYIRLLEELGYVEGIIRDGVAVYKLNRQWLFPELKPKEVEALV